MDALTHMYQDPTTFSLLNSKKFKHSVQLYELFKLAMVMKDGVF
jgi:hypothetical protein